MIGILCNSYCSASHLFPKITNYCMTNIVKLVNRILSYVSFEVSSFLHSEQILNTATGFICENNNYVNVLLILVLVVFKIIEMKCVEFIIENIISHLFSRLFAS